MGLEKLIHIVKDRLNTGEHSAGPLAIFTRFAAPPSNAQGFPASRAW